MSSFEANLNIAAASFVRKYAEIAAVTVAKDAIQRIVKTSPVGNPALWKSKYVPPGYHGGQFRANWNVSVGSINYTVTSDIDPSGSTTIARGNSSLSKLSENPFQTIYIANSLPYAYPLEHGHSTQAPGPAAIVGKTHSALVTAYGRLIV